MPSSAVVGVLFAILSIIYLASAPPLLPHHIDPLTNTLTAWNVANEGSFYLDRWEAVTGPEFYAQSNQIIRGEGRPVSKYPPGSALLAVPLYLVFDGLSTIVANFPTGTGEIATAEMSLPALWPSVIVGAATTAGAVAVLFLTFETLVSRSRALVAATAIGLGTSLWTIASQALWQHGPAALAIAIGLWALAQDRMWLAGVALAPLLVIRPQAALAIATSGLLLSVIRRTLRPAIALGVPASLGVAAYLGFNTAVFGEILPEGAGGYAVTADVATGGRIDALRSAFFDRYRGVFVYSPFTLLPMPGLVRNARAVPDWAWASLVGGALLLVFQVRPGDFSGGVGFFGYRYPIEALVFASPALVAASVAWVGNSIWRQRVAVLLIALGIAIHAVGALT